MASTLSGDRLTLREWTKADLGAVFDIYSRWEVVRYLGRTPMPHSRPQDSLAAIERWRSLDDGFHGVWAIVPHGQQHPVGSALLKLLPLSGSGASSGRTEIGWHLHPDAWGRGWASEAAARLLEYAWQRPLAEVVAVTYPENLASQAVCARLGMDSLGTTADYYDVTSRLFGIKRPDGVPAPSK